MLGTAHVRTIFIVLFITLFVGSQCQERYHNDLESEKWNEVQDLLAVATIPLQFSETRGPVECQTCQLFVGVIQETVQRNTTIEVLEEAIFQICLRLAPHIDGLTPLVCWGTVESYGDMVVYIFSERFLNPEKVCEFLERCPASPAPEPTHPSNPATDTEEWKRIMDITLRSIENDADLPRDEAGPELGTFIQISDVHLDERYFVGSNALCERPLCCRASSNIPLNQTDFRAAGRWGDYNCDVPELLLENMWEAMKALPQTPDFILYTGDNTPHDIWAQTEEMQQRRSVSFFEHILENLPGWRMLPSIGNHEGFPVDQFGEPADMSWLYDPVAETWASWLSEGAIETFKYGGYYTDLIAPGLRVVGLNSQYCDAHNFWLLLNWQDAGGQIAWLNQTLQAAKKANEKVWLIGHIPFNSDSCIESYSFPLWSLVDEYKDIISSSFFGHTHSDSFMVFKDFATNTNPIGVGYIAPSVTPYTDKNPAFRVYQYNRTTFEVVNYHQYIMNLTDATLTDEPVWEIEYNPIDAYGMKDLSAGQWLNLVNKFEHNNHLFNLYRYYTRCSFGEAAPECDDVCKSETLCELQASTNGVYNLCANTKTSGIPGFINYFCPAWWN